MMFHYALYVSWILLWNCYAHQTYPQLSESSHSQTATIQKLTAVTARQEELRDLRSSVATGLQENQFKKTRDVIASAPRDSDDPFYTLNAENRGTNWYQQKPTVTYNDKPVSSNNTDNGSKRDYKNITVTDNRRTEQLDELYVKEKKLFFEEDPKNKYEKVSERHKSATADKTINDRTNDKDLFINLKTKNQKVHTLNPSPIHTKPLSLRSVSNDQLNESDSPGDSLNMNSDTVTKLAPSYDTVKNKRIGDSQDRQRSLGRPGHKSGYKQAYQSVYRPPTRPGYPPLNNPGFRPPNIPGYQPPNRPGNGPVGPQSDMSKPSVVSCNLSPVGSMGTLGFVVDTPFFLLGRRKRAALSVPISVN